MKKQRGFTLIELMVVVAFIGIISAIAFPSYNMYMKETRRADAMVGLSELADKQERYYLTANTYALDTLALGLAANPAISDKGYYELSVDAGADASGFALTAKGIGPQAFDKEGLIYDCTEMYLDSTGLRTSKNAPPNKCW